MHDIEASLLIVDDNEHNRDMIARRLKRHGYRISHATGGRDAIAQINAQPFDLVLLDLMMPEINGYDVLQAVGQLAADARPAVIVVSAIDDLDSVTRCLELGAEDYLTKPFHPILLRTRVEACLAQRRSRRGDIGQFVQQQAARLRQTIVPEILPQPAGWELAARCMTEQATSWYDVWQHDNRLVVCFVSTPAAGADAPVVALLYSALGHAALHESSLPEALPRLHSWLSDYMQRGRMIPEAACLIAEINLSDGLVHYINTGGLPAVIVGTTIEPLAAPLQILGRDNAPSIHTSHLASGQMLLIATGNPTAAAPATSAAAAIAAQPDTTIVAIRKS
ncbi:MAG TPA: response regulator [Roseiflexaceae bacterium]|nr:response regulator [Roseiflexaceae bacterium]HMP41132.1 response regulator [Roseiflexaceae bacterium]